MEIRPAMLAATRFRETHEADWLRLAGLLDLIEKGSVRRLSTEDLVALPVLYRATLSSLSLARSTSLDKALIDYLEQLSVRAYFVVYGVRTPALRRIGDFFLRGLPTAVSALKRETLAAALLLLLGTIVGYLLVRSDPSWFYGIVDKQLAGGRDPSAAASTLRDMLYKREDNLLATFATFLFTHNAQMAILAFALGFAFGVPTALLVIYNGVTLGAFLALYSAHGLVIPLGGWLLIHGTTELFAIILAGAAGFRIGLAMAFPGRAARLDAITAAGREAATAMLGVVFMLGVAGILEGIVRQTVTSDIARYAIAATALAGWLFYFYGSWRRDPSR